MADVTILGADQKPLQKVALGGGLEGADRSNRELARWSPSVVSADQQINPVKDDADFRSRDTVQNDGYTAGAVFVHRDSIVGSQFRLNVQPDYDLLGGDEAWAEEYQRVVESRFNLLADSEECWFDAGRKRTLTGLIRLAVGGFLYTGEILGAVEWIREQDRPFRTAIQLTSPSRLCNPDGQADTRFLRRGVASNYHGAPVGYWFRNGHATETYDHLSWTWRYVEARKPWGRRQVLHIYDPLQPDQTRGIADMVAALKQMRMTRKFQEVVLQNAVVNATYAAAIESELPREVVFGSLGAGQTGFAETLSSYMGALSDYVGSANNIAIDGVKLPHLFPGTKLNLKPMGTPGGVGSGFEESLLRYTAAALGVSYEELSRDYSRGSYSSIRASALQTWRHMQGRKKNGADKLATMIFTLWLEEEINAGNIPLPPGKKRDIFYDPVMREALCSCTWIGSSRGQVDELKETQSALMRIKGGLSTYEKECASLGEDYRRVFKQRAREQRMIDSLGLEFDMDARKSGSNSAQKTMKEDEESEDVETT